MSASRPSAPPFAPLCRAIRHTCRRLSKRLPTHARRLPRHVGSTRVAWSDRHRDSRALLAPLDGMRIQSSCDTPPSIGSSAPVVMVASKTRKRAALATSSGSPKRSIWRICAFVGSTMSAGGDPWPGELNETSDQGEGAPRSLVSNQGAPSLAPRRKFVVLAQYLPARYPAQAQERIALCG